MRVTIERSAFLKSLNHVQSVVERRNTIPILSNVLIQARNGAVKLTATDLDLEIVETVPAEVAADGSTTAPAHMIYDIVRKLPDGAQLQLETSGGADRLSILAGRSRFALQTLPSEDFPDLATGEMSFTARNPQGGRDQEPGSRVPVPPGDPEPTAAHNGLSPTKFRGVSSRLLDLTV